MDKLELVVEFPEHTAQSRLDSPLTGIAAYGDVAEADRPRTYRIIVRRASKLPRLKERLITWERYGFLRWRSAA